MFAMLLCDKLYFYSYPEDPREEAPNSIKLVLIGTNLASVRVGSPS